MMHVDERDEPDEFDDLVRKPGKKYLTRTARPTSKQFSTHDYWTKIKLTLHERYGGICSFVCHWIPHDTGSITVEHYKPKVKYPNLAYEWSNYRLMCGTLNGRKSEEEDVLDPFKIEDGMFILEFPSLLVKPTPSLSAAKKTKVRKTINRLKLNDEGTCIKARERYVKRYCLNEIDLAYLQSDAPFIHYELVRQNLTTRIRQIMPYGVTS